MSNTNQKPCLSSSSAETIGTNLDLLIEILLRLPAKSLLKFTSVSKQWLSLISDPKFRFSHTRHQHIRNPTPTSLLLNNYYSPTPEFQLVPLLKHDTKPPFLNFLDVPRVKIEQSCNGLLICSSTDLVNPSIKEWESYIIDTSFDYLPDYCSSVLDNDDGGYRLFACNPTTKQFKRIYFPVEKSDPSNTYLSLVFHALKSPFYKIICMRAVNSDMGKFELDVYSSETESWGLLRIPFRKLHGMNLRAGVFCNGSVHWYSHEDTMMYFDVDSESLKTTRMPPVARRYKMLREVMYFGESLGHLHMVTREDPSTFEFDVFEMASDYSVWFVKYHVNLHSMRKAFPELVWYCPWMYTAFSVLSVVRARKEEESTIVLFVDGRAMSYTPHSGISKKICDIEPKLRRSAGIAGAALDYEGLDAYHYFESFICV